MTGLSNTWQAVGVFASGFLMTLGAATIPTAIATPALQWIPEVLFFCGAVGFAIKEALGSSTTAPTSTVDSSPPTTPITSGAVTTANVGTMTNAQILAAGYTYTKYGPSVNGQSGYVGIDSQNMYVYQP